MTDRPIIFSAPMIRALLAGTKTQTRRRLSPHNLRIWTGGLDYAGSYVKPDGALFSAAMNNARDFRSIEGRLAWITDPAPHQAGAIMAQWLGRLTYNPGDRLWVREAFCGPIYELDGDDRPIGEPQYFYRADGYPYGYYLDPDTDERRDRPPWHPSIHMPRGLSRLTLAVTGVRLQRLQEITCADAIAEGIAPAANSETIDCATADPRRSFADLWDHIHGPGAWDANPEVVAITFAVADQKPSD